MIVRSTFFIFPTLKTISCGAHRRFMFRHRTKQGSAKWMVWRGMTGRGLTSLYFIPQGQTVTAEYYATEILEKEVRPLLSRRFTTEKPIKRKLFTNKLRSRRCTSSYGVSNPSMVQEILTEKIGDRQIHLILTLLKTYGAPLRKLHTEIR